MKNISKIIWVLTLCISGSLITSCSDFLNPDPESLYTTQTFYTSQTDFELAISAVYAEQQDVYDGQTGMLHFLTARSDDANAVNTNTYSDGADIFIDTSTGSCIANVWESMFVIVIRCNSILIRIDDVDFDDESTKNYIKGEAYAMRAWAYDNLAKFFGGVPLIVDAEYTTAETYAIARSTQDETFAQAVSDYKAAISLLPESWDSDDIGRITEYAADAALGRLYMFMNEPANAKPYLEAVINSGIYSLAENYEDCFTDAYDNDVTKDRVWEVQYIGGLTGEGQTFSESCMPEGYTGSEGYALRGSSAAMQVSTNMVSAFEDGDYRETIATSDEITGTGAEGYTWCTKYSRHSYEPQSSTDWANNLPIIRYSDVLLMCAEAINATEGPTSEAIGYVNEVRNRAELADLLSTQTGDAASLLTAIKQERRVEFMFEALRWFDLVRWGDFVTVMSDFLDEADEGNGRYSSNVQSFRSVFAIPQAEMDRYDNTSVMWQNTGY
ncbi:RagB/SusD family nutrient uptake outer membrane protein [Mangrovibacterium diazotrophicum]|uniref:Putative outer membrane starch-binding protein n=1 Tax=Mangrovibacterium diazotrophicum TaxID=1261403 RepID=A0A419W577_9BACT|nr:RagB/SusD family nutrient uptake outer membrane protein [Mangrovibacterium diazotrophicum]RKD90618.1 putative outer membrane starch-binding protein [Mangrovibacterium diazotrophicum]